MQTQVQKESSIRLWHWILKVNGVNIWALQEAGLEVEQQTAEIKFSNSKLPPRRKITNVKFKATMVEFNFENIKSIFGWELTTVDAQAWEKKKKVLTYDDVLRAIELYPIEFVNTDAEGKKFGIKIFKAYATNSLNFTFPSDEELDKTIELPIEFGAYPNEDNKYFEMFDEQDVD